MPNNNDNDRFNYSYISKVLGILFKLRDEALAELELVLNSSLDLYRVCSAYGLWYNMEDGHLYVVFDRKSTTLFDVISSDLEYDISSFAIIGMDLCETVSRFHDSQLVTGCTSLSCYGIDDFGHILINLNDVLMVGQRLQKMITEAVSFAKSNDKPNFIPAFPSPEVLVEFLQKQDVDLMFEKSRFAVGYSSDVWSLACILLCFLVGKSFIEETRDFLASYILTLIDRNDCDSDGLYVAWLGKVYGFLDTRLGSDCALMKELLHKCLGLDPATRPNVNDLWKCMRELIIKPMFDVIGNTQHKTSSVSTCHCLLLGDLLWSPKKTNKVGNKNGLMNDEYWWSRVMSLRVALVALATIPSSHKDLLSAVKSWPPVIYSALPVIAAIEPQLNTSSMSNELKEALAVLYKFDGQYEKAFTLYADLMKPDIFEFIEKHNLHDGIREKAVQLMLIDHKRPVQLLIQYRDVITPAEVVSQLLASRKQCDSRYLLYEYLHSLFEFNPLAGRDFHDMQENGPR